MGKTTRDLAILSGVGGGVVLLGWLVSRAVAKPPPPGMAKIEGVVLDQQTEFPIPFAKLTVDTLPCPVNEYGGFLIEGVPLGKYTVKASAPGYRPATLEWSIEEAKDYLKEVELVPVETLW